MIVGFPYDIAIIAVYSVAIYFIAVRIAEVIYELQEINNTEEDKHD